MPVPKDKNQSSSTKFKTSTKSQAPSSKGGKVIVICDLELGICL
jgi:hypothetical protein